MKNILKLLLLLGTFAYLVFAVIRFSREENVQACSSVTIEIADSAHANLISVDDIERILRREGQYPLGVPVSDLHPLAIEDLLEADPFILRAMCVVTPGERVRIIVAQHIPLLRVITDSTSGYYINEEGTLMAARGYEANLAVATGAIDSVYAKRELHDFGVFLREHPFWDNQIEQIQVNPNREVDLIMRVGGQVVHFGRLENWERKLRNLRAFYENVLPVVGWRRYKEISVAYENQVIGKK